MMLCNISQIMLQYVVKCVLTKTLISKKNFAGSGKKRPAASLRLSEAKLLGVGLQYALGPSYAVGPGTRSIRVRGGAAYYYTH